MAMNDTRATGPDDRPSAARLLRGAPLDRASFARPPRELGIMPFWFWNGAMERGEIDRQLAELRGQGLPGFFIHARFGVRERIGYLSEEWFASVRYAVDKAREMGLLVGIYDEYNWPSGTAGGEVMRADPAMQQRYLQMISMDVPGEFFTFLEGTDSRYIDMEGSEPVFACAIRHADLAARRSAFVDLMPSLSFDKVITWEAPRGPWKLLYFVERRASWYIDALDPEATRRFLSLTHEGYLRVLGPDLASRIVGFYTDEPAMHYFEAARDNAIVPWSKRMFTLFRESRGYDLKPHLPKLFFDLGDDTARVRHDFWSALSDRYEASYFARIGDWCRARGVAATGHLLFEESLRMHARAGGNLFNHLRHFDLVGVDHLYPRIGSREQPEEHVALKLASSAAHHFGSRRLLCESMGGIYWDATPRRMKWIADWEYVLGVNLLNPHGFHYSIEGERKRDWPPSQFYHHSWWRMYGRFNAYLTRLGHVLSAEGTRHAAAVALLYPLHSIWAGYVPQAPDPASAAIERDFNDLTDMLLRRHADFDYLDEDVLQAATIEGGGLRVADERYELLVLPPLTHLKAGSLGVLERFVHSGGVVVADTLLPGDCVGGLEEDFADRVARLFGVHPVDARRRFPWRGAPSLRSCSVGTGRTWLVQASGIRTAGHLLSRVLDRHLRPLFAVDDEEVFSLHRTGPGRDILFLVNPTADARDVIVHCRGTGVPELWEPETGGVRAWPACRVRGDGIDVGLAMVPYASALLVLVPDDGRVKIDAPLCFVVTSAGPDLVEGYGRLRGPVRATVSSGVGRPSRTRLTAPARSRLPEVPLDGEWEFEAGGENALVVDRWKMAVGASGDGAADPALDDRDWLEVGMGAWEDLLPMERDPAGYPEPVWYRIHFTVEEIPREAALLVDGVKGRAPAFFLNGEPVAGPARPSRLDAEIGSLPLPALRRGANVLAIRLEATERASGLRDLVKIVGPFGVAADPGRAIVAMPRRLMVGDWTERGLPFYSGTGWYSRSVEVPVSFGDSVVLLRLACGDDVAEIEVNGEQVDARLWPPYEADVTALVKPGTNRVRIGITNTMENLLKGIAKPSGLFGAALVPCARLRLRPRGRGGA